MASALALSVSLTPAAAGEPGDFDIQRQFELPAHRALVRARANSGGTAGKFTSDGCSGGLSSAWMVVSDQFPEFAKAHGSQPPWEACCVIHDVAYHSAGASPILEDSFKNRLKADEALRDCVVRTGRNRLSEIAERYGMDVATIARAYRTIANAMYLVVRLGGGPCSGIPWRWGYGYRQCFVNAADLAGR